MRLTVHVSDAKKGTHEKTTKDGVVKIRQTFNTLSYSDVSPDDVIGILNRIKDDNLGTVTKHYLTNERIPGHTRVKKKK